MSAVRGHEPTCPIARETWCVWPGDKCDWCAKVRAEYEEQHNELEYESLRATP